MKVVRDAIERKDEFGANPAEDEIEIIDFEALEPDAIDPDDEPAISNASPSSISDIVADLVKSLDNDSDMSLNIEREIAEIQSLSPEEPYRMMFEAVLADKTLTTHEQISELYRIISMRSEDREKSASIVKDVQDSKVKNFKACTEGHAQWILVAGVVILVGGAVCTPIGRNLLKSGAQFFLKRAA